MASKGFTLIEMMVVIALAAILMAFAVPAFVQTYDRMHHDAAVRRLASDVREARSKAIAMGWEYRIVGYRGDATSARKNQYRVLARKSGAVAWPDEEAATFVSDTQRASNWINVAEDYPNVDIEAGVSRFEVTFDSRGAAPDAPADFNPVRVVHKTGLESEITVSVVGGVRIQ